MAFAFTHVTDLLDSLESLHTKTSPLPSKTLTQKTHSRINDWFDFHHPTIQNQPTTLAALFSLLLPHLRPDRSYALRETALIKIIIRSQLLGSRADALKNWRESRVDGDFAAVVGRVIAQAGDPLDESITVEYLDIVLNQVAAKSRFSSGRVLGEAEMAEGTRADVLEALYRRLTGVQAKWVTRVVLKCLAPVEMPGNHTLSSYHFLLPHLFKFQQDLNKACTLICTPSYSVYERFPTPKERECILHDLAGTLLKPVIGVKVGRPEFVKARSCKHAATLAKGRKYSLERKYDGEYIQIHIDTTRPDRSNWLTLFSKSGRNSTDDRIRVHDTILDTLTPTCATAILEGELLVYSAATSSILPFHHLRAHIPRAGTYIYAPTRAPNSHLMIILFDVLLHNKTSFLHQPYQVRLSYLSQILPKQIPGRMQLAERETVDFGIEDGAVEIIRRRFAKAIVDRWEGFVLKPWDAPYVPLDGHCGGDKNAGSYGHVGGKEALIKLKKDYMVGCGDTGDFAVIGAAGAAERGWRLGVGAKALTVFHVGCLMNKEEIQHFGAKPKFKLVFEVSYGLPKVELEEINRQAPFRTVPFDLSNCPFILDPLPGLSNPTHIFTTPLIFELTGGGFEKHTTTPYYVLRHPRVCKVHHDRQFLDATALDELQESAKAAMSLSREEMGEEEAERRWTEKLLKGEETGGIKVKRAWSDMGTGGGTGLPAAGLQLLRRAATDTGMGSGLRTNENEVTRSKRPKFEAAPDPAEPENKPDTTPPPETVIEGNDQTCKILEITDAGVNITAKASTTATRGLSSPPLTGGNDQESRVLETTDVSASVTVEESEQMPRPSQTWRATISQKKDTVAPPAVLRDISPQANAGRQGRRRSSSGGNGPPTVKQGIQLGDHKGTNPTRNTKIKALSIVSDNGINQQLKIPAPMSHSSQLIEQQLILKQELHQKRCYNRPPPIPNYWTTLPEMHDPPELQNGHSRNSPLLNTTVLLPHYLLKFPELLAKIKVHNPAVVHGLPATAEDLVPLVPESRKCVVLVEPNKTSLTKKTLKELKAVVGKVQGGVGFEVYDWRLTRKTQPEGMWEVDWSLFHVWSLV